MRMLGAMFMLGALALSACAEQEMAGYQTASGRPEAFFREQPGDVSGKLAGVCAEGGILVQQVTSNQVTCGGTMTGGDAVLAQMLIGNSYSTTPSRYVTFTMFPYQGGTRVQTQQWIETQMAFGQVNRSELNSGALFNETMAAMQRAGGTPLGAQVVRAEAPAEAAPPA